MHFDFPFFLDHRYCFEEEQNLFIDVECKHPEAVLTPMPEGLSQQQVSEGLTLEGLLLSLITHHTPGLPQFALHQR